MNSKNIDLANIVLVVISLLLAIWLPFKLFLISYAILGPLHYLTEINWLNEKKYFIKPNKKWIYTLFTVGLLTSIYPIVLFFEMPIRGVFKDAYIFINSYTNHLILFTFLLSISFVLLKKPVHLLVAILLAITIVVFISLEKPNAIILTGIFLPTLIHVYLFTIIFIFFGALKTKSRQGIILGFLVLIVPIIISNLGIKDNEYIVSNNTLDVYIKSNLIITLGKVAEMMSLVRGEQINITDAAIIKIQIFIAFAYTYHYLNWFSKTSIIGWKKAITSKKAIIIGFIWLISVALYYYNYALGFIALFFLSMLHVLLEFPLNITSMKGIITHKSK